MFATGPFDLSPRIRRIVPLPGRRSVLVIVAIDKDQHQIAKVRREFCTDRSNRRIHRCVSILDSGEPIATLQSNTAYLCIR